ncbi:anaerobic ribonucleoside-triphosphate reductase [Desulfofarcimen acetoxidans DSM 771]|uniref:Anaerobic ribonucleoside-triphosphate reductase n=1 Tax=Desulfofarcimen acetoxidans (strain ATCC 49208 / DSM 771 / KCTC 5769 / VKM B-1644 / 5575) TaxID=485916 RepID=C8W489_DESAS|nr:anaerobic ribonucleoside-triphosphate reductase [Desulfofarcimen acetoxidans]ACV61957.1 anaerobic ribonucleoside-triphosphate reductase [Desulfofarcimen acetoxidans DSM 771]
MFNTIKKRDGREVSFDDKKITDAIFRAARSVGGEDRQLAMELTIEVLKMIKAKYNGNAFGVEDVQDIVEKVLIENGHARTAKAYILYRDRRTRMREAKGELMDAVEEILVETSKENANVSNSPSAKMLQIASAASKKYYLTRLIPDELSQAHTRGDIHIHDLDFYGKTLTCIQIPLKRLLEEGFDNGHGYIRPPQRPNSATALAAIILQSSQNDMHGGQSFAFFDRDIAPYVENASEDETFQAMEALVYNLNSMHSLRGSERIWILDKEENRLKTVSMEEFHEQFEEGKFAALSVNYTTGKTELKDITASLKHNNFNRLLQVKLKSGQRVEVTDNHSMMAVNKNGEITTAVPEMLSTGLTPARWQAVEQVHTYELSKYPNSSKYQLKEIVLDEILARFLGFYVAEGAADGSTIYLSLFNKELEAEAGKMLERIHPDFSTRLRYNETGSRDLACRVGQQFAAFVADICGKGAQNKRVPSEIFFATDNVIRAFLDGYLSGDGTVGKNRVVASSVSQKLRDGIFLLLTRLGLMASMSQEIPSAQYAAARERYKIAIGGYYATALNLSGPKQGDLASLYQVSIEQSRYDYEYLRPLIADVYGVDCRNAYQYRIKPVYIEELIFDLKSRRLTGEEEEIIVKLASSAYWFEEVERVIPLVKSSQRHHLRKLLAKGKLPRYSKYLSVRFPYADWLPRFMLSKELGFRNHGGMITSDCRSPEMVMRWARAILNKNLQINKLLIKLERALEIRPVTVDSIKELPYEPYVYDISVEGNENFLTSQGIFVHNSRAGAQVPFSSLNLGTETSEASRKVTRNLLMAYEAGLGRGENPIFPNIIFRVKEGINLNPDDPNYDLFKVALRVASKRLNPTFSFMDAGFNSPFGDQVSYMGCRTRVMSNRHGQAVTDGRGNLSFTTVNLPRVAIKAERNMAKFYRDLEDIFDLSARQLYHRYQVQAKLKVRDMPFVMGQGLYMDSQGLRPEDVIEPAIKHGTLAIGFIGLAETLTALTGKHHGESKSAQEIGQEIVAFMAKKVDEAAEKYDKNYTFLATPAEGLSGRFIKLDRREYGIIPGVTNKEYYTNSFHIPVNYPISIFDKISLEGVYHKYCNAGHISYVELEAPPVHNIEAMESIVRHMKDSNMGYAAINYPVDFCTGCSHLGVINEDICPRCGSPFIRRVRRITGYLSTVDRFNDSKVSELKERITHRF